MPDRDQLEQLTSCGGSDFRELYEIYAASIAAREQKPKDWICAMVQAPEYKVWVMKSAGHVEAFSILFLPRGESFALLEYMAVTQAERNHGVGSALFKLIMARALTPDGHSLPVVLEVDSDREACGDQQMRTRRQLFYRRLGCVRIVGLHYILPLSGEGAVPAMDLLMYSAVPRPSLPKVDLQRWLTTMYRDVYHCPADDPRILRMLRDVPDPVRLE
ncbi:MAG TPA: GNAT family N-acetyltransferase [Gemmatimonadales bacterium]|nr:GNAT family N-acetyltransferase [Gemmatimonadales bacterium]